MVDLKTSGKLVDRSRSARRTSDFVSCAKISRIWRTGKRHLNADRQSLVRKEEAYIHPVSGCAQRDHNILLQPLI